MASSTLTFTPVCSLRTPKAKRPALGRMPSFSVADLTNIGTEVWTPCSACAFCSTLFSLPSYCICTLNLYFVLSLILEFVNSEFLYIHQLADSAATTIYLVMYLALFTNRVEVIFMSSFEQSLPCHWWVLCRQISCDNVFMPKWGISP